MKLPLRAVGLSVVFLLPALRAVERLPIEDFARPAEVAGAQLSPDGKYFAYVGEHLGLKKLHVAEVSGKNVLRLDIGGAGLVNGAPKEVGDFAWVSDRRLVVTSTIWDWWVYGVLAVDCDGAHETPLGGNEGDQQVWSGTGRMYPRSFLHRFYDKDANALMLDPHWDTVGSRERPDVLMVHTKEGLMGTVVENPGNVAGWIADQNGAVRIGITSDLERTGAIYRDDANSPWRTIVPLTDELRAIRPVGFDPAGKGLIVAALTEKNRRGLFPFDPATGTLGPVLLRDDDYDVVEGGSLIYTRNKDRLLGVRYQTERTRTKWFDPEFAKQQRAVDRALPATNNIFESVSMDGKRSLWFASSDQDPGAYYLLDTEQHTFKQLAPCRKWIKPSQMAPMLAVKYAARDGLIIHGFLTVPVGHEPKHLPLVILPHGGPWARDLWEYDTWVQLIANRGYAVLQMDYRGSTGYGEEHRRLAKHEIGGKIQDDIEDATRWAIAAGVADPKRIAIFGASYGGYSTLFALGHNPGLYRYGISLAGVTDWLTLVQDSDIGGYKEASGYWRAQLGDAQKDKERLRASSPVYFADKITAPVLIIQGKDDRRVPPDQARRMIGALEKAGRKPESLFVADAGHNDGRGKDRVEVYKRIVSFLEQNLGPGVE